MNGDESARPDQWARDVLTRLSQLHDHVTTPAHLVWRLDALLGASEPRYVDSSLAPNNDFTIAGTIVVYTDRHVGVLAAEHVPPAGEPNPDAPGWVKVDVLPRSALARVTLPPVEHHRANDDWNLRDILGSGDPWQGTATVALTYPPLPEPIVLPLSRRAPLQAFLPALLDDLQERPTV